MSKMFLNVSTLLIACFGAYAQNKVPQKVESAFGQKYPEIKSVKWEKETADEWEAEFKKDGIKQSAIFLTNGTWLETEQAIKPTDLPSSVASSIHASFKDYKIEEAEKVTRNDSSVVYEVSLEKGKSELEVLFSENGTIQSKKHKSEDSED